MIYHGNHREYTLDFEHLLVIILEHQLPNDAKSNKSEIDDREKGNANEVTSNVDYMYE